MSSVHYYASSLLPLLRKVNTRIGTRMNANSTIAAIVLMASWSSASFGTVQLLYSIFLGIDGAPASVSICKDVGKDAPVNILAVFVAGDYQAVYYGEIAVQAKVEVLEALFQVRRRHKLC